MLPPSLRYRPSCPSFQLAQRTFRTFDFYKKHQDAMTPAGLAFFQCRWDDSVTHTFHQLLGKGIHFRAWWSGRPGGRNLSCLAFASQGEQFWQSSTPVPFLFSRHAGTCV